MVHKSWTPEETPKIAFGWSPGSWVGRKYRWLNDIKGFVVTHLQTPALSARSCSEWSQLELIGTSPAFPEEFLESASAWIHVLVGQNLLFLASQPM